MAIQQTLRRDPVLVWCCRVCQRLQFVCAIFVLWIVCSCAALAQLKPSLKEYSELNPQRYELVNQIDGAQLYRIKLHDLDIAYLQTIDLEKMRLDQIIVPSTTQKKRAPTSGQYFPGQLASPYFEMQTPMQVISSNQLLENKSFFSMFNGGFFEDYESSSRMAFPVKLNGKVISAGSSPYGPIARPADRRYASVQLRALVWDEHAAKIVKYDPASGAPLTDKNLQNGLVTYRYQDHPAYVFKQNVQNRFVLLAIKSSAMSKSGRILVVLTTLEATLGESAQLLREFGVEGDIVTLDGGSSTYLFNREAKEVVSLKPIDAEKNANFWKLPHYLVIRKKAVSK
jgi:Phosphodiester glycosidase